MQKSEVFLSLASESFPVFSGKQVIAGAVGLCEFPTHKFLSPYG